MAAWQASMYTMDVLQLPAECSLQGTRQRDHVYLCHQLPVSGGMLQSLKHQSAAQQADEEAGPVTGLGGAHQVEGVPQAPFGPVLGSQAAPC